MVGNLPWLTEPRTSKDPGGTELKVALTQSHFNTPPDLRVTWSFPDLSLPSCQTERVYPRGQSLSYFVGEQRPEPKALGHGSSSGLDGSLEAMVTEPATQLNRHTPQTEFLCRNPGDLTPHTYH